MESTDIVRNPIVLGILSGTIVYLYMYWQEEQKEKKNENRKPVSILIPGVVASFVWFITGCMNGSEENNNYVRESLPEKSIIYRLDDNVKLPNDNNSSFGSKSFRLVGRGNIQLPDQDVFLDLADF